ncbi:MAG: hypothetical protein PHT00_04430 [Candidatus Methanomethylophilus sp.]|nr:hypothetical protein [Methanomethylophilus sp.]MDD3233397.1 hypothetical protein [Methanomethylophilus sp.]MDD4221707.1 hypothetical protein [Methanomethylophilus sp.]MDD4668279.1 hypothetical protein [Methanomethylophilus sp.]
MNGELDPNADLFSGEDSDGDDSEEQKELEYVYGNNPRRVSALSDLWYQDMMDRIKAMDLPSEEARLKMVFKLTAGGVLDMLADSQDPDNTPDVMTDFDIFLGMALTNKHFGVDLFKEEQKALMTVKREEYHDDEEFKRALGDFEEAWWDIAQPALEGRTPNDAIKETLHRYGLN